MTEVFWSDEKDRSFDDFYSRVKDAYTDLTFRNIKYGQESKSIIYTTKYDKAENTFTVELKPAQQGIEIFYTIDNSQPTLNSLNYKDPIKIVNTTNLRVGAFLNKNSISKEIQLSFSFHKALNAKLTLINKYEEQYRANGDNGILDGLRGTLNFRDGLWQGYEGKDFEAIIDLEKNIEISEVSPRFILNTNSWIFFPEYVEISLSEDGQNFTELKKIVNDIPQKNPDIITKDFTAKFENLNARYIKVKAKNIGKCPVWHPGVGGKTWLFIDEIIVN
ncbi:MAG: chitobiase/beta-hexosaminidase C-terminal domain-containing protein [Ignavibacteriae bacterium]|nr:chitobiase/beta-hexosaminidase C-terminal domain-containing protein [Ignavibacteriota bacterium]